MYYIGFWLAAVLVCQSHKITCNVVHIHLTLIFLNVWYLNCHTDLQTIYKKMH